MDPPTPFATKMESETTMLSPSANSTPAESPIFSVKIEFSIVESVALINTAPPITAISFVKFESLIFKLEPSR